MHHVKKTFKSLIFSIFWFSVKTFVKTGSSQKGIRSKSWGLGDSKNFVFYFFLNYVCIIISHCYLFQNFSKEIINYEIVTQILIKISSLGFLNDFQVSYVNLKMERELSLTNRYYLENKNVIYFWGISSDEKKIYISMFLGGWQSVKWIFLTTGGCAWINVKLLCDQLNWKI